MTSTRDQFIATARSLFAARGFSGASLAAIADALGLTKQALLHHFSTKEKLYGVVLSEISAEFMSVLRDALEAETDPGRRLRRFFIDLAASEPADADRNRLLMRELLDNARRADTAETWPLKPFLERLTAAVKTAPGWAAASDAQALAATYQLLGAVTYFSISEPTLRGIFGDPAYDALDAAFVPQLDALVTAALASPPA